MEDFDIEELISDVPRSGNMVGGSGGGGSDTDALIRQLSAPPPTYSAPPPPPPPSVYRPSGPPSYVPPPTFAAAARAAPPPPDAAAAARSGGGGGWWSGIRSMFWGGGGATTTSAPRLMSPPSPSGGGFNADSATMVRKRKRKLLREMRQMVEADAAARKRRQDMLAEDLADSEPLQVRCTEASSLEEIEEEHDMVSEEHNERVGMDTARTFFVATCGQAEWANDTYKPFGDGVKLMGFEEAVKDNICDYEADIRTLRESVLGLGLPQWCYTAVKLGVDGGMIVAANRVTQSMADSGMDAAVAYHPRVRDAVRQVTAHYLAEAATGSTSTTGGTTAAAGQRVGPGPPMYVNNKPRMPDPDTLPRPGSQQQQAEFPMFFPPAPPTAPDHRDWQAPQQQQQQQQFQQQPYTHDPFVYRPPSAHPNTQPIVHVPLRPPTVESLRDTPADRSAYRAQQNAFRDAQMQHQQQYAPPPPLQQQPNVVMPFLARPDLVPPSAAALSAHGAPYIRSATPAAPPPVPWVPEETAAIPEGGGGGIDDNDMYADMLREEQQEEEDDDVVSARAKRTYSDLDNNGVDDEAEAAVAAGAAAAAAADTDARSVASTSAAGKRRRRTKQPTPQTLIDDDLAMSMM